MTRSLAAVVIAHLGLSLVHGTAHAGAHVFLPLAGTIFVYVVILAAPLAGLAVSARLPRTGAVVVAGSMTGALVFGLINHFIIPGSDHVTHVAADWRPLFTATAALLAVTEAAGVVVGVAAARQRPRRAS